ncbi:MAG: hypothetical protein RQ862_11170 [Candidatus Caldarchaeales archaeon]|nr:hypothetical protein [Candidatus Caldarchaeales archaeon]
MMMTLVQFAIPERLGEVAAEAVARVAGGATLLEGMGLWVNGEGVVEREKIKWLVVGVEKGKMADVVGIVLDILRSGGESAAFYITDEPRIQWLKD